MGSGPQLLKVGECLYRNPTSGTYYALVKVRGKQIKKSLETDNLPEARRKLKEKKAELQRIDPAASKSTLAQVVAKYRKTIAYLSEDTKSAKERTCRLMEAHWPRVVSIGKVKPSEVSAFLAQFSGASNHNSHLEVVRSVFDLAKKDGILGRSPAEDFKYRKRKTPIRRTPTQNDFRAIVKSIREQPLSDTAEESADVVEFYGLAGLGQAEVKGLLWPDVQFERVQITIKFRLKTGTGFVIPIYPQVLPLLKRRHKAALERNGGTIPADEPVFSIADPKKAIDGACKRLSLPKFSGRSFRRMFITTAIERGVDVKVIAQWQGHKDGGKLILDTYSHVRPVHSERMALLMTDQLPENVVSINSEAA